MLKPRATLVFVAVLIASLGCRSRRVVQWHEEGSYRWRELSVPPAGQPGFTQLSPAVTGLTFTNPLSMEEGFRNTLLFNGSGVALGDVDGDGLVDIFLPGIGGRSKLYRNLGDLKFEDATEKSGLGVLDGRHATGAVLADVNGDGSLDLLVTALGGPNSLFINDGHGRFTEMPVQASGLGSHRGSMTMTLADVDGDGTLALYIANYKARLAGDLFSPAELAFNRVVHKENGRYTVEPKYRAHFRVRVQPKLGAVTEEEVGEPGWFYMNDGKGHFTHVPLTADRFLDEDGKPFAEEPAYFSLTASFHDVNGDGFPDLYICNDFENPDQFWLNDGRGHFRLAPRLALRTTSLTSMGMDFADLKHDGTVDFFVTDMLARDSKRRKTQIPSSSPLPKVIGDIEDRPQVQGNSLFFNRGDGTFAEIANYAGIKASEWSWGALFLDVDLDGNDDLLIATGYPLDAYDGAAQEVNRTAAIGVDWRQRLRVFPRLALENVAFRNNGDLTFSDAGKQWGFATEAGVSYGIAAADLDGDGDLDVVVSRLNAPVALYRNNASAPRIAVRLIGRPPNTEAIGSKIRVLGGPVREQTKEVTAGGLYLSSSDRQYSFAAGQAKELTIEVDWRSNAKTVLRGVKPNRAYEIREPVAGHLATERHAPPNARAAKTLFSDVSSMLDHTHVQPAFDDYVRQPLLPNKLSQLGPGVSWYDVDGDGYEDLFISSGREGTLSYFHNDAGRLRKTDLRLPKARFDETSVLLVPDGRGATSLLLGQSNYTASPQEAPNVPSVLRVDISASGSGSVRGESYPATPGDSSSVGPMALADIDGDGNLDLFAGGRVVPGYYPEPASSRLFRRKGGRFVLDTVNQPLLSKIGLVSAAVFSDINGDGFPDLVLAPEWGSLKLLLNDGTGRFRDASDEYGLTRFTSRWNGVTTGDLDGDGRPDIIATSWGRNTQYHANARQPLFIYYGGFDMFGTVVQGQYDARLHALAPLESFNRIQTGFPSLRSRIKTFSAYADATMEDVVGPYAKYSQRLTVNTLDHMVFFNRGSSMAAVSLPMEAQFAPAFYAGVADFDGDGNEDLFISQNFFPTFTGAPRYDGGRGLLLLGDGSGALHSVPGQRSGIGVYGDSRGAAFADYNNDGRVDLVVSQNGAKTKLYRNDGATPGLRVRLVGSPGNPRAVGAMMRVMYSDRKGPEREVHAGSGYWSEDGAVQVLGLQPGATGVWVRWPGGTESKAPLRRDIREITIRMPSRVATRGKAASGTRSRLANSAG